MALGPAAGALVLGVGGAAKGLQGAAGAVKSGAQSMQNTDSKAAYLSATKDQRHALGKAAKREILAAARAKRAVIAESRKEAAALKESEMVVLRAQVEEEERRKFVKRVRRDLRAAATAKAPAPAAPAPAPPLPAPVARHSWAFA
ncbi:hypothetical protein B484DRAFT_393231 [Ochromonadaceae sp. CCMP2298]|nr:hypothetical protein B484DRAFT_393231 [Ochromonadaceae sp. CCMP2298]